MSSSTGGTSNPDAEKFGYQSKERDIESGYDYFEARLYDSATGRFLQVDAFAEKYNSMSSYLGMGANPITYMDPTGDTIVVNGENAEGLVQMMSDNLNGLYDIERDPKTGKILSIKRNKKKGKLSKKQENFLNTLTTATSLPDMIPLIAGKENSESVFVDDFASGEVDIGDLKKLPKEAEAVDQMSFISHVIGEQLIKARGETDVSKAHANGGNALENAVNNNERMPDIIHNSSKTRFDYKLKDGKTHHVTVYKKNNNIVKIKRVTRKAKK